jgi:hypothetical protein
LSEVNELNHLANHALNIHFLTKLSSEKIYLFEQNYKW